MHGIVLLIVALMMLRHVVISTLVVWWLWVLSSWRRASLRGGYAAIASIVYPMAKSYFLVVASGDLNFDDVLKVPKKTCG